MGYVIYGNAALDQVIAEHNLGHAGGIRAVTAWPAPLTALAPAYFTYAAATRGWISVTNPGRTDRTHTGPVDCDATTFTSFALAALTALTDILATDPCRQAYRANHLDCLAVTLEFDTITDTVADPDRPVVVLRIETPGWIHKDIWPALPVATRDKTTVVDYWRMFAKVSTAWSIQGLQPR
jgi:hypothetical protein